ncbi:ATP-dependent 6-phosphofructokinase [Cyanobacterium aponinum UTEX 3222]|uniref:ATP-dependent 6-phosphofructokinase n=2 Tax=Cyanobacterium aponinum TaxID=379064 RepID=A0A844GTC9_9CHRO|nr:ATP-dependent 6-phosphofructokinase [Cyanobacterium aponinum]MBD2392663.1 6-phosphofructokinase [Cyanobacterium aponinum FACHB-4101]MTF38301.1 ATP-dependent 6-phosphofructokinase [Cyanobacterium aponinum 0216]WPF87871.1 ATP-dependent 6-phosphofructokinase [Cyanobacterium aponinum AL20115]WRL43266.1 ATP-dependent 6-phosphofructokinase [Cyanobacterium aponinum UTEX 3222]
MKTKKRIGILTSGGDCPGLNAIIRAVVKYATLRGWEVYGIPRGTDGFIDFVHGKLNIEELKLHPHGYDLPGVLQGLDVLQFMSGSVLGSLSRGNPQEDQVTQDIIKGYEALELDALIAIGGDGSLDIIYDLAKKGNWNLVVIPKTIDNDVAFTERSVGFDTARNTVTQALYDLTFTAASHERIMVVQVMGRDAGHLSLHAGIAGGADCILIPELTPQLTEDTLVGMCEYIAQLRKDRRKFALIVIAEGVKGLNAEKDPYIAETLADLLKEKSHQLCSTGGDRYCGLNQIDTRATVLGHLQRCGVPSSFDRILATVFAIKALDLIGEECYNRLVIWQNGSVESKSLEQIMPMIKWCHQEKTCPAPVDPEGFMVRTALSLGIYLGESHYHPHTSNYPYTPLASTITNE